MLAWAKQAIQVWYWMHLWGKFQKEIIKKSALFMYASDFTLFGQSHENLVNHHRQRVWRKQRRFGRDTPIFKVKATNVHKKYSKIKCKINHETSQFEFKICIWFIFIEFKQTKLLFFPNFKVKPDNFCGFLLYLFTFLSPTPFGLLIWKNGC